MNRNQVFALVPAAFGIGVAVAVAVSQPAGRGGTPGSACFNGPIGGGPLGGQ